MGLRESLADLVLFPRRISILTLHLLVPPDAVAVRRCAEHIIQTIAVNIQYMHMRTILTETCFVKSPARPGRVFGAFPPSLLDDDIFPSILVYVAIAQAMRKAVRTRNILFT